VPPWAVMWIALMPPKLRCHTNVRVK
jgi:hypothetical protein